MIPMMLSEAARHVGGKLVGDDAMIKGVSTDSRKIGADDLFVALKGERFDAHDFCSQVKDAGARALLVSRKPDVDGISYILVDDTRIALGLLAKAVRDVCNPKVIGVTGTCGKTSVKDMLLSICSEEGRAMATDGNFNNDIGAPLTMLRMEKGLDLAVIEMGTNHPGELRYIAPLVSPDVVVINNVGYAHLEGFGSLRGVFEAKSEAYEGLKKGGTAIFCGDSEFAGDFAASKIENAAAKALFGSSSSCDVYPSEISSDETGFCSFTLHLPGDSFKVSLKVPGRHNVLNACAAAAAAHYAGVSAASIKQGLENCVPRVGRLRAETVGGYRLIDDAYNASVNAVRAAVDYLSSLPGRKVMILGDMGELGKKAAELHAEVGRWVAESPIDDLLTLGPLMEHAARAAGAKGASFASREELYKMLPRFLEERPGAAVLVKGSHGMRMHEVLDFLRGSLC